MLDFLKLAQLVLYIALLSLLGQGVLYLLAGARRDGNVFYRLLQAVGVSHLGLIPAEAIPQPRTKPASKADGAGARTPTASGPDNALRVTSSRADTADAETHGAEPDEQAFSWWDYRGGNFHKKMGLRIDYLLASRSLASRSVSDLVHRNARNGQKPSDHAPLVLDQDEGHAVVSGDEIRVEIDRVGGVIRSPPLVMSSACFGVP